MPKVSVILPVYNVAPYLDEAFTSIINQTLEDIEVIVVNDGSTDNSQDIIDRYAAQDSRIVCLRQENRGLSGARNTGLRHATGEYVYYMDSDDTIRHDALCRCYEYAERHHADVCIFDAEPVYEKGAQPITWDYNRAFLLAEDRRYDGRELMNLLMDHNRQRAVVWLQFTRRELISRLQLNFLEGIIHEDELYTPQLFLNTDAIYFLDERFVYHRIRRSSIVGHGYSRRNVDCYLTVIDHLMARYGKEQVIRRFAGYTLSAVFYTAHVISPGDKWTVFRRACQSGYLRFIGWKSLLVFWFRT